MNTKLQEHLQLDLYSAIFLNPPISMLCCTAVLSVWSGMPDNRTVKEGKVWVGETNRTLDNMFRTTWTSISANGFWSCLWCCREQMTVYEMIAKGLITHPSWRHRNTTYCFKWMHKINLGAAIFYYPISAGFIYFLLYVCACLTEIALAHWQRLYIHGTRKEAQDHKPAPGKQSQLIPLEMPPAQNLPWNFLSFKTVYA